MFSIINDRTAMSFFSSFFHRDHQALHALVPSSFDVDPFDSSWSADSPTSLCAGPIGPQKKQMS